MFLIGFGYNCIELQTERIVKNIYKKCVHKDLCSKDECINNNIVNGLEERCNLFSDKSNS